MSRIRSSIVSAGLILLISHVSGLAQEIIKLPDPKMEGGMPLLQAMKERKSSREFSSEKLPLPVLSNLLWAAWGVNRPDGHHTAPSASNRQEIDVYVATADGLYLYEAKDHQLRRMLAEDIRQMTGTQPFVKDAPVNLVYVADLAKGDRNDPAAIEFYTGTNAAFLAQNVYLFCASEKLATVVRASIDRPALAKAMKLRANQKIALAQSVGYPKQPPAQKTQVAPQCSAITLKFSLKTGESFEKRTGLLTFKVTVDSGWQPPGGWNFSLEDADGRDYISPVNPPFRYNLSRLLGRGYDLTARDSLKRNRQVHFLLSAADYNRLEPVIRDALYPYMAIDPDHAVDRYRSAVNSLQTGLVSLKILEFDISPEDVPRSAMFEVELTAPSDFQFDPLLRPRPAVCPPPFKFQEGL